MQKEIWSVDQQYRWFDKLLILWPMTTYFNVFDIDIKIEIIENFATWLKNKDISVY